MRTEATNALKAGIYSLLGHKFSGDNSLGMEVACASSVTKDETDSATID